MSAAQVMDTQQVYTECELHTGLDISFSTN